MRHALITLRKYHQLTQLELANKLVITHQYVSRMEAGSKHITAQTIRKLCRVFKIGEHEYVALQRLMTSSKTTKKRFSSDIVTVFDTNFKQSTALRKYIEWDLNRIKP